MKSSSFFTKLHARQYSSLLIVSSLLYFAGVAQAKDLVNTSGASGVALSGYDPVAFFSEKKPVNGDPGISAAHKGAKYFFSSKEHRSAFNKNPDHYAPQFGGFCAYGTSVNALFPVDISTWQVREGKLYFNLNPEILKVFNKNISKHISKANKNWPKLTSKHGE